MSTNLEIANRAIREVGGRPITALDAVSSTANIANDAILFSIEEVLSEYEWPINTVTETSTGVTTGLPDTKFAYNHDLTALANTVDRVVGIADTEGHPYYTHRLEGTSLHADEETLFIRYTFPMTDVATMPPYLSQVIAAHLAKEICIPLSGDQGRKEILEERYIRLLGKAKTQVSRQRPPQSFFDDTSSQYLEAHNTYGDV